MGITAHFLFPKEATSLILLFISLLRKKSNKLGNP